MGSLCLFFVFFNLVWSIFNPWIGSFTTIGRRLGTSLLGTSLPGQLRRLAFSCKYHLYQRMQLSIHLHWPRNGRLRKRGLFGKHEEAASWQSRSRNHGRRLQNNHPSISTRSAKFSDILLLRKCLGVLQRRLYLFQKTAMLTVNCWSSLHWNSLLPIFKLLILLLIYRFYWDCLLFISIFNSLPVFSRSKKWRGLLSFAINIRGDSSLQYLRQSGNYCYC